MRKKLIVVSRKGEDEASITALRPVFNGDLYKYFGFTFGTMVDAAEAIQRDLKLRGIKLPEAVRYAHGMTKGAVGEIYCVPEIDMYYRILEADFTSNGRPITPGLRVEDYDRREGTVKATQFMDDGVMAPGGEYFRQMDGSGWYEVVPDGMDRGKTFDGSRMRAL